MSFETVQKATRHIADLISDARYANALQYCASSRLSEVDLKSVMDEYGRTFVATPSNFADYLDSVAVEDKLVPTWSIRTPLWTQEEGRSDLTLELTITDNPDGPSVELDDLRVL